MLIETAGYSLVGLGAFSVAVFGPNLTGLILLIIGIATVLLGTRRLPVRTPLDWPALILFLMGGVSLLASAKPDVTFSFLARLAAGLVGMYVVVNWTRNKKRYLIVVIGMLAIGLGLALISPFVVDWLATKAKFIPDFVYQPFPLLVSDPVHPNIMASIMTLLLPMSLALMLSKVNLFDNPHYRILARLFVIVCALFMSAALLLTKSRGGYIAVGIGMLLIFWLYGWRKLAIVASTLLIALGALFLLTIDDQTQESIEQATSTDSLDFRIHVWEIASTMAADFPFTGVGMGTFNDVAERLYPYQPTDQLGAHNLYLQVAVDLGLIGLISFLAIILLTYWLSTITLRATSKKENRQIYPVIVGTVAGFTAYSAHGMVDGTMWGTRAAFLPWLVIGLIVASYRLISADSYLSS